MNIEEKIKVLQASIERKTIQWKSKVDNHMEWEDMTPLMEFNFATADYRIKPEAEVRPYTFEEMKEAVKKHGLLVVTEAQSCWTICCFDKDEVSFYTENNESYEEFMRNNVWLDDNSPCGIVEE